MLLPDFSLETALGVTRVAGVDEAGRGPLAGPVVAAAVVLDRAQVPIGLNDSKKLSPARRAFLFDALQKTAETSLGWASVEEIDRFNIRNATFLAMQRALNGLYPLPTHALIDGNAVPPDIPCAASAVVKGDARCLSIAAASIMAKVARDQAMDVLAKDFPDYGWDTNKGYPTTAHRAVLQHLGPTPHHRRSFAPVRNML